MIPTLVIIALAFTWLLFETDFMRVRLLVGEDINYFTRWLTEFRRFGIKETNFEAPITYPTEPIKYTGYCINRTLKKSIHHYPEIYLIYLSPNCDALISRQWLDKHWNDLADYKPEVEMTIGGVRYKMLIKAPEIITKFMKVNKLSKQERARYAVA